MRTTASGVSPLLELTLPACLAVLGAKLTAFHRRLKAAAFDPGDLSEALRRDAGIEPCEVERLKARRRDLIR